MISQSNGLHILLHLEDCLSLSPFGSVFFFSAPQILELIYMFYSHVTHNKKEA